MSSGYGLTKPVTPKSKDQQTGVRPKRQDVIFTATPTPIKWVIQLNSSEMAVKVTHTLKKGNGNGKN